MNSYFVLVFLISNMLLSVPNIAMATGSNVRCLGSAPTSKQNVDINIFECSYIHHFSFNDSSSNTYWYPVFNIGALITPNDSGLLVGGGGGLAWRFIDEVSIFLEGGMYWAEDYEYGTKGVAYKDYGGPWQYFGKLGLSYHLNERWSFGYAYLHISNAKQYEHNPAFNGHSVFVNVQF